MMWLFNYIPKPVGKGVVYFKDKFVSFFKTNTHKQVEYRRGKKLRRPKTRK